MSIANIFGLDAIGAMTVVGRETERIELATGVVPTYPRHPMAIAQQALTAGVASKGRFTLGIGLSHQVVIEGIQARIVPDHANVALSVDGQPGQCLAGDHLVRSGACSALREIFVI